MKELWKYLSRYDKILIISLLVVSLIGITLPIFNLITGEKDQSTENIIVIQKANKEQERISVSSTYSKDPLYIRVEGPLGISIIEAHNGKVRMKEAPPEDPEKICEKIGWIEGTGPMIICVPNQISIWIEADRTDLDGVSW